MKKIEDYETAVVCGFKQDSEWVDNIYGRCVMCDAEIMWRPHSPSGPDVAHVCPPCGLKGIEEMRARGEEPEIVITEKSQEELAHMLTTGLANGASFYEQAVKNEK